MGIIEQIDAAVVSAEESFRRDGARQAPASAADGQPTVRVLYIPEDVFEPIEERELPLVDGSCYDAARAIIKSLIQKVTPVYGIDFLMDEEGQYSGHGLNRRATALMLRMMRSFAEGRFPGRTPNDPEAALEDAALWAQHVRLLGPIVIIGADERTGAWVSLPETVIVHSQTLLGR